MAIIANLLLVALSLIMGIRLLRQYRVRARAHTLWYAVGLLLTAVAATPEVYLKITGSLITPLWWVYWVAASSLVGYLAVGTAYLLGPGVGKVTLWCVSVVAAVLAVLTVLTAGPATSDVVLHSAPNLYIKIPFLIQNIGGSMLIFVGAVLSWLRNRGWYNVWIALGTLCFAAGGGASGSGIAPGVFYFTQAAGIVLLYFGVTQSTAPRTRAVAG